MIDTPVGLTFLPWECGKIGYGTARVIPPVASGFLAGPDYVAQLFA
jgi:hypothetical protein